jgi:hypothetical protein
MHARALLARDFADHSSPLSLPASIANYDVWTELTSTIAAFLPKWIGRPVACDSPAPRDTKAHRSLRAKYSPPTANTSGSTRYNYPATTGAAGRSRWPYPTCRTLVTHQRVTMRGSRGWQGHPRDNSHHDRMGTSHQ